MLGSKVTVRAPGAESIEVRLSRGDNVEQVLLKAGVQWDPTRFDCFVRRNHEQFEATNSTAIMPGDEIAVSKNGVSGT